jgi:nucleoside-diphosphate-sugar epimerase
MTARRVLLTGASGFIGRHCIAELLARGYQVHATTSRSPPSTPEVRWHQVDLLDTAKTAALVAAVRPDSLLHLAWYAEHGRYWQAPENLDWVGASLALLRAFIAQGGRRATFAGSCAEYDWAGGLCSEDSTPLQPQGLYGVSKHAFHQVAATASRGAGVSCAWSRIFFLYGPGEQRGRLLPQIVRAQLGGRRFNCATPDLQRDYLYVGDVAAALVALLDSPLEGAVNIGSGRAIAIRSLVDRVTAKLGRPELVDYAAAGAPDKDTPPVVAATARLGGDLKWTPRIGLERGLDLTIDWWRQPANAHD